MATNAILFDLGNTLVKYYQVEEFEPILRKSVDRVLEELELRRIGTVNKESAMKVALEENREAPDFRFSPMANRLERIFNISLTDNTELSLALCEAFLVPIFKTGIAYEDVFPVLKQLKSRGLKLGIVSNSPWGSPAELWRIEIKRLGFGNLVETIILCGDVGWRKPSPKIFEYAARSIGECCGDCTFVGDDVVWDMEGSAAVGMQSVLLDRYDRNTQYSGIRVTDMNALIESVSG